jgi:hypothetical protein
MNIILPEISFEKLSKKKINNLVIDIFEDGRHTYCYSNSPSEWQKFSTKRYYINGFIGVLRAKSEDEVEKLINPNNIILLDKNGFKAGYWMQHGKICEFRISQSTKKILTYLMPADTNEITDHDLVDQVAAICGLPYTTNPTKKYLLSSTLQVLNWDLLSLDKSTREFFKFRNDYVNINSNLTVIFEKGRYRAAVTMGTKEKSSYFLKFLNEEIDTLISIKNQVLNDVTEQVE